MRIRGVRNVLFAAALMAPVLATAPARAGIEDEGRQIIQSMSNRVIALVRNKGVSRAQREKQFENIFRTRFDVETIGRWVLGRAWRSASVREQSEYQRLFESYIVKTYTVQLSRYTGEKLKVVGVEPDGEGVTVISHIVNTPSGKPIEIKWRMRKVGEKLKVRDVVINNISMSLNQRREFATVLRRRGGTVDGIIAALREKIAELDKRE